MGIAIAILGLLLVIGAMVVVIKSRKVWPA
jgi:hypothetical protein